MMPSIPIPDSLRELPDTMRSTFKKILQGEIPQSEIFLFRLRTLFSPFVIYVPDDFLTFQEMSDVEQSLLEIKEGKYKKFSSVDECIEWLHEN